VLTVLCLVSTNTRPTGSGWVRIIGFVWNRLRTMCSITGSGLVSRCCVSGDLDVVRLPMSGCGGR